MVKRRNIDKDLEIEILIFYKTNSTAVTCQEFNITPDRLFKILQANGIERHDAKTNRELTNLKKFGVTNPGMLASSHEKAKQTTLANHGSANYRNSQQALATRAKNAGSIEDSYQQGLIKQQQTNIARYGVSSYFTAPEFADKALKTTQEKYGVDNYRQSSEYAEKYISTCREKYGVDHYSKTATYKEQVRVTCTERYGATSWFRSDAGKDAVKQTSLNKYGCPNPMQSPLIQQKLKHTFLNIYGVDNPMHSAEVRSKQAQSARVSSLETVVAEYLTARNVDFCTHYVVTNEKLIHEFDIAIFLDDTLIALVDCDGLYYHGYLDDYNGKSVNPVADDYRMLLVDKNIDLIVVSENNYTQILDVYFENQDYKEYIYNWCRCIDFPYPVIKNPESSYRALCKADCSKFSMNSYIGMRVANAYHKSIWFSNRKGYPSPYEAWSDNNLLKRCIDNRLIYVGNELDPSKVLYGFSAAKIAPKVSVFNPYLAKYLINKYLNEFETIFDPCSGYSGRMLGCCSLGKRYIGQDISPLVVDESCNIINDFQLDATVSCIDSLDTTECEYDCLFTCTPYGDKELWQVNKYNLSCDNWIECLVSRYNCKKYLFVVDETVRYSDYIVETITNKSHLNTNVEYVILIDNTNS